MTGGKEQREIPAQIGPYEVIEELGHGGMGVVYLARDPRLERRVAIKTLSAEHSRDAEWSARFGKEARLLASLNHPNIATIYSLEREGELIYLTMELIEGKSLERILRTRLLTLPDALATARQIARGLEAAHAAGVIHRDLKPLNVMLTADAHVKLLDFGLATRAADFVGPVDRQASPREATLTRPFSEDATMVLPAPLSSASSDPSGSDSGPKRASITTGMGTPGYMSPEQVEGEALDASTDVWAFGCVLFELLTGKRAFSGPTAEDRVVSALRGEVDLSLLPATTPPTIRELIVSCLQVNRAARLEDIGRARAIVEKALSQRAWQPDAGGAGDGVRVRSEDTPHNLPNELTPLIGREREITEVRELLARHRLVTLTGVGGCGKTRLAMRVGLDLLSKHGDGVWIVELAPIAEGAGVSRAVAQALGVTETAGTTFAEAITEYLSSRKLLLILDNAEHLVAATAELCARLLNAAPGVTILATSREVLGLPGESVFQVPPLQVPPSASREEQEDDAPVAFDELASAEAVRLFAQRAFQVRPDFRLEPGNVAEVAEVCRRLEGLPLAIELAAARTKVLSIGEIARRLDDRFRLLRGVTRTALPHHQTLEALIEWSHAALLDREQQIFRRLALFRGGWTLEAAESICSGGELDEWEILDLLTHLIDKSLVVFHPAGDAESGRPLEPRYRMLETVREFALHRLRESEDLAAVEGRFVAYFLKLSELAAAQLTGPQQPDWIRRLDAETENIRAALLHGGNSGDPEPVVRLAGSMLRYWLIRGQWREGRRLLERVLALPGAEERLVPYGVALNALGSCCYFLNDLQEAEKTFLRAVEWFHRAGNLERVWAPLMNLGNLHRLQGNLDRAREYLAECLRHANSADPWVIASISANLGSVALVQGLYEESRTHLEKAIECFRELGDRVHAVQTMMNLGLVAYRQGRLAEAQALQEEASAALAELGERSISAAALTNLGIVHLASGDLKSAARAFSRGLRIVRKTGSMETTAGCLEGLSQVVMSGGDFERGVRLAGAAEGIRKRLSLVRHDVDQEGWDTDMAEFERQCGTELYARLFAEGETMPPDAAIALALEGSESKTET